ncbi:MAG TPA: PASTA domain-containing protein [Syntrophomonadaceae bacterium]|nr:PASTA domain-containing protein [Syntrophomonadaceae bacterium]
MIGTVLGGRYEILELISEGGTSLVYKAHCRMLDRIVAVKILKDEYSNDLGFVQKFKTESLAAAQLSHPNIVNIFDVGQQDDTYYIVMEYIQGQTLKEIINQEAPLPLEQAITIAAMICDGLQHAHERGIIHRDIKPNNIIITEGGIVKVADFGIAKAISKKTITYGGNIVGSVHYISPEQARGEPVTRTTDIYSVGCVIYEMLTGQMPFDAESPITVALKHIHDEPTHPRVLNENIPRGVETIIQKTMAKLPAQRYATAQELRNALLSFSVMGAAGNGKEGKGKNTLLPFISRKPGNGGKRRIKRSTLVVIGIALLGLLAGFLFTNHGFFGKEVEVPDLVGLTMKEAQDKLTPLDLTIKKVGDQSSDKVPADQIISQTPAKGQKVKTGREIEVVVSKGAELVTVPSVIGKTYDDAELELRGLGFKVTKEPKYDDKYTENIVMSQKPGAKEQAAKGSTIQLLVSQGKTPGKVVVPDLMGKSLDQAKKILENSNLSLGTVHNETSNQYAINKVCQQNPNAGTQVDEKSIVEISLSTGPGSGGAVKSKSINYTIPDGQTTNTVVIQVTDGNGSRSISVPGTRKPGEPVSVNINYVGSGRADVYLNDSFAVSYSLP